MNKKKRILITGAAGFIGSNLINSLLQSDNVQVIGLDNFDDFYSREQKEKNMSAFISNSNFSFIEGDIRNMNDLLALSEIDVIVYGINQNVPWNEEEKLMPISPYASTKLSCEMLGHVYHHLYGIRFLALRFFTVYGPAQRPDLAIHKFFSSISKGQEIPVFGDGSTSRDYTFVDDTVHGIISAIGYDKSDFEIINLGNHQAITLSELILAIENICGKKAIIDRQPEQAGDVPQTYADISKAQKLLNYHPETKLETGLLKFYEWYKNQNPVSE